MSSAFGSRVRHTCWEIKTYKNKKKKKNSAQKSHSISHSRRKGVPCLLARKSTVSKIIARQLSRKSPKKQDEPNTATDGGRPAGDDVQKGVWLKTAMCARAICDQAKRHIHRVGADHIF